ncbi:hypothetical protein [Streptomyces sp. NPDC048659]|uniref:hypothetical protein n=1 Tax=Streptomyces sp. NPDC048659 TaxID=3155489 RepID=UPI003426538A
MAADGLLGIDHVEQVSDTEVTCVVRCLRGTVSVGDVIRTGRTAANAVVALEATVHAMWRYGRPVEFVDTVHTAKVMFTGAGARALAECREVATGVL